MEVRNGFIVGIFNYCDRWCEACAFTSHCRVFADGAAHEASLDPNLVAVTQAPPLPQDVPPPPPKWLEELLEELNDTASRPLTAEEVEAAEPRLSPEHESINARAMAYCLAIHRWQRARGSAAHRRPDDPLAVIDWFASIIASKIYRALDGLADDDGDREFPPDHEGSAKVAIIGIERSHAAWRDLVSKGVVTDAQAQPFLTELAWLLRRLDEVFPLARSFVRPGFDEPEDVARLRATEGAE